MEELRQTSMARIYYRLIDGGLVPLAIRLGISADQATLLGLAAAVLVPPLFLVHPLAGGGMILLSGLADSLDGLLARRGPLKPHGAFFDSCVDRISDSLYLMGIWLLFWPDHYPMAGTMLMAACLTATQLISYVKARAESLGAILTGGLMERAARVIFLLAWTLLLAFFPAWEGAILWTGGLVYLLLTAGTAGRRMAAAKRMLAAG
jgi:CDP-diacylglycerol--glycerol-3-phosphate 3-phosphatidyltransferase